MLAADRGRRVLLVDVDGKGDLATLFEHAPVGFSPVQVHPGVLAMSMDTEASLQEYLRLNLKVPVFGRLGPLARVLDFVATAAPGSRRSSPSARSAGRRARRSRDVPTSTWSWSTRRPAGTSSPSSVRRPRSRSSSTSGRCARRPIGSSTPLRSRAHRGERRDDARGDAGRRDDRARRAPAGRGRRPARHRHREPRAARTVHASPTKRRSPRCASPRSAARCSQIAGPGTTAVLDGARLAVSLRRTGATHLAELDEAVDLPLLYVPFLFARVHGRRVLRMVADALGDELGL